MGAAASYIVSGSDFFTPSDLKQDADTLAAQVTSLGTQVESSSMPQNILDAWYLFVGEWRPFYADHFGGFLTNLMTALNDGNRDQLVQFEQRFAILVSQVQAQGVETVGTDVGPKRDIGALEELEAQAFGTNPDGTPKSPIPIVVLLLIVAAVVAVKVL